MKRHVHRGHVKWIVSAMRSCYHIIPEKMICADKFFLYLIFAVLLANLKIDVLYLARVILNFFRWRQKF